MLLKRIKLIIFLLQNIFLLCDSLVPPAHLGLHIDHRLALEGPLFVVAFDIDETLLDSAGESCVPNELTESVLEDLLQQYMRIGTRLHSLVVLTNGYGTTNKFRNCGLPPLQRYFSRVFERQFTKYINPVTMYKDLDAMRREIFNPLSPDYGFADRIVIVLVDDKGSQYSLYNHCYRESHAVAAINVIKFEARRPPNSDPNISIEDFKHLFLAFINGSNLLLSAMTPHSAALALESAARSAQNAKTLLKGEDTDELLGALTSGNETFLACPHLNPDVKVVTLLVLDAGWMLEFISAEINGMQQPKGIMPSANQAIKKIIHTLAPLIYWSNFVVLRCTPRRSRSKKRCQKFQLDVSAVWAAVGKSLPPLQFSSSSRLKSCIRRRDLDGLSVLRQVLYLPEKRTLTIIIDSPKAALLALPLQSILPSVGFFNLDVDTVPGMARCMANYNPNTHFNEYQLIMTTGMGVALEFLRVVSDKLAEFVGAAVHNAYNITEEKPNNIIPHFQMGPPITPNPITPNPITAATITAATITAATIAPHPAGDYSTEVEYRLKSFRASMQRQFSLQSHTLFVKCPKAQQSEEIPVEYYVPLFKKPFA